MRPYHLILSCAHAVNTVPPAYLSLFKQQAPVLQTHRAIDLGAAAITSHLSRALACDVTHATVTRLLIDCNRSLRGRCFSEFTLNLPTKEKQQLIDHYYKPFRQRISDQIITSLNRGERVLHLSIHSFTPVFNNIIRNADIGLLYDPTRISERTIAYAWREQLKSHYRVRMNYPYRGISDGHTTCLRKEYGDDLYSGLELECNQVLMSTTLSLHQLSCTLADSLIYISREV